MRTARPTLPWKLGTLLSVVVMLAATGAVAQITVTELPVDTTTGGDWRGVYGDCFFLIPQPPGPKFEYPVGPDPFGQNPGQYEGTNCYGGELFSDGAIDWRIYMTAAEIGAFAWSYFDAPGLDGIRDGASQWNPCLNDFQNGTWDDDRFVNDPMVLELTLTTGGDGTLAYYMVNGDEECRELDWTLEVNGVAESSGSISDFASGKYVVFELAGLPDPPAATVIRFIVDDHGGTPTCAAPAVLNGLNSVISGAFVSGTDVCAEPFCGDGNLDPGEECEPPGTDTCDENCMNRPIGCRFTGGGVDTDGNWDHSLEDGSMIRNGAGNLPEGTDRYTFGGQVGASTVLPPQPSGEWTHHQQRGPAGRFTFHGGTNSAPEGTRIVDVRCSDPENCNPARSAPAKQLDFDGIGTFKSIGNGGNAPIWEIAGANVTDEGHGNQDFDGTYHWFEVNIDDLGEPGGFNSGAPDAATCPSSGFGEKGDTELAECDCPDFYRITIYDGVDKATLDASGPNKTDVLYEVFGYVDGGNLQLHPPTGNDTN